MKIEMKISDKLQ